MVTLRIRILVTLLIVLSFLAFEGHCKKAKNKKIGNHKKRASANTFVGKFISTQCIEYEALNGLMTPKNAKKLCDEDLACAGFTYKGANGLQQKFHIKFFHYIPKTVEDLAKINGDWTWTSYKVPRSFVLWPISEQKVKIWTKGREGENIASERPQNWALNSLVNPILGVQFKFKDEVLNLKDFLPDSKIQSSKWMVMVNLNASLYQSTTCIDNSLERNEYQEVLQVQCGQNLTSTILQSRPVIFTTQDCLATCQKDITNTSSDEDDASSKIFENIRNVSSWIQPQTGKSIKRETVNRDVLFKAHHIRAVIHDRSVQDIKKILINSDNLAPFGHEEDLATKLGLRRSSQLFVDFWKKGQKTTLVNPQGTTVTYYYVEGDAPLELLLMPTNSMAEIDTLVCDSKGGSMVNPSLTIHGKNVQKVLLQKGDMIYVAPGWALQVLQNKANKAVTIAEARLSEEVIEDAAVALGEQEIHFLKKALVDPHWHLWRRLTQILLQRRRTSGSKKQPVKHGK